MGNNMGTELKNTINSLWKSAKTGDEEETMMAREEDLNKAREKENSHTRMIENAKQQDFAGRKTPSPVGKNLNSVTHDNRPVKAILVNESSTVRVMEPKKKNDVYLIINEIKNRQPVLIKLGSVEQNEKRSILDTLYGACSFAGYTVEQVDLQIILIDPSYMPNQR